MPTNTDFPLLPAGQRLKGRIPKLGIRPVIDGRRKGVREALEEQVMAMAESAAALFTRELRHANGLPVECVIADTCIGGVAEAAACAEKFQREGVGGLPHGHALLVLRLRDDGHGSPRAQGGVGLQRHRAPRGGVPGGGAGRLRPEGPARLRHLWPRRAGQRTTRTHSRRRARQAAALRARRAGGRRRCAASPTCRVGGVSMGIAGSIVDQDFFEAYLGMRVEARGHDRVGAPHRGGHLRPGGVQRGRSPGCKALPRGPGSQPRAASRQPGAEGPGMGRVRQVGADRARPDGGQSAAGQRRASAKRPWATTPSWRASRASASGPTTSPTAISSRRCSTRQLRLERHSRALPCGHGERLLERRGHAVRPPAHRTAPAYSPMCAPTGAPRR